MWKYLTETVRDLVDAFELLHEQQFDAPWRDSPHG